MIPKDLLVYESYIDGKMTKRTKAKGCLELVHTNVYGPFCVYAWIVWAFHHFTNKYSRFGHVHRKSNTLDTFIEFKARLDNLLGKHARNFDLIEVVCLVSLILSIQSTRLYPSFMF